MKYLAVLVFGLVAATRPDAHATLEEPLSDRIERAQVGETILVSGPSVVAERLVIQKPVRLIGTNSPVIDAGGWGTAILIAAADVEIRGFVVRNTGRDLGRFDSAVRIEADRALIENCRVENEGFGIYLRGVTRCAVRRNFIAGAGAAMKIRGNGIHLWKAQGNEIAQNEIKSKRDGIYLSYADRNEIRDNRVEESRFGIHYMYSHHNRLLQNRLSGNAVGATLMFARMCRVEGNRAIRNARHGFLFKQLESSDVTGNEAVGHNRGFFVQQSVQNRFAGNLIKDNAIGLYLSGGSEENRFSGNKFINNTDQVWQPPDEMDRGRTAGNKFYDQNRGNYWRDYTGMDQSQDGIGDTPYYETDVYGYLLQRNPGLRVFAFSPAVALLRQGEKQLPLAHVRGIADPYPLMSPGFADRGAEREEEQGE